MCLIGRAWHGIGRTVRRVHDSAIRHPQGRGSNLAELFVIRAEAWRPSVGVATDQGQDRAKPDDGGLIASRSWNREG